ncbi:peptidoglycan D,D-transpeptidase FtsI family protein [Paenibacillus sp. GCM10027627]|uniref:peptidoglycan D,D-transpeptidase FtsI family protein n=1 Tax=unclassified Paenibacillus TaxID=185978 RepID=UPI00363A02D5
MAKRAIAAAMLITVMMLLFLGRLAFLQLFPGHSVPAKPVAGARESWKRTAVVQRQRGLILDTGRGDFVDRYGRAITGETYWTAAFFPISHRVRDNSKLEELARLLQVSSEELMQWLRPMREADFWRSEPGSEPAKLTTEQAERIRELNIEGFRVLPYRNRYVAGFDSKHWVGFTSEHPEWLQHAHKDELISGKRKLSEQVGGSGLERSLDSLLHGIGETSVSYYLDGQNVPLHGLDLRVRQSKNPYYPLKVVTTVDLQLQNEIEAYADKIGLKKGAIVVLDANNSDIVAMVSRPNLNNGHFQSGDGSDWENHALQAVEPGSIYKLVTAASALENGLVHRKETFHCNGEYGKYGLSCWKEGGHGKLTLKEGLAKSCNIVFAELAERLSGKQLQSTARKLGVIGQIGWHSEKAFGPFPEKLRLFQEEEEGRLFANEDGGGVDSEKIDGGIMAQSGIGQRDVRMSPLQAANLIVTLLNGGRVMEPRIVSEIRFANGRLLTEIPTRRSSRENGRISTSTAHTLLDGMRAVVDHGTGKQIKDGVWEVAGKTGTAESKRDGKAVNHQWFAGYGPVKSPQYAVAVLSLDRPVGSAHQATSVFRGVMDLLAAYKK